MPVPQFTNMADLSSYLSTLESRINTLETEKQQLENQLKQKLKSIDSTLARDQQEIQQAVRQARDTGSEAFNVLRSLPQSGLLSRSFITRAFSVWGHLFVAQLIISLGFFVLYLIFVVFIVAITSATR